MTWVLFTLICSLLAAGVLYPVWSSTSQLILHLKDRKSELRKSLREQRASLLLTLRELDFDYEMGKLSKEDYINLRERYQSKTVEILKNLEEIDAQWKTFQEEIDQELLRRQKGKIPTRSIKKVEPQFCSSCGNALQPTDRFCSSCGKLAKRGAQAHA